MILSFSHLLRKASFGVAHKIRIGFAIVLMLHISIAIIGYYGLSNAEHDRHEIKSLNSRVKAFFEIDRQVCELQRNVLLFAHAGFKGPELRAIELQDELDKNLNAFMGRASDEEQEALNAMREHIRNHRQLFAFVIEDRAKRSRIADFELRQIQEQFETSLLEFSTDFPENKAAISSILATFRSAILGCMRFVQDPDSLHVRNTKQDLELVQEQLASLLKANANVGEIAILQQLVQDFNDSFIQMVQSTRGYLHLVNVVLAGETKEFLYLTQETRRHFDSRANVVSARMEAASHQFHAASTFFSLLTIVLGIVAAWLIERSIAPPLKDITMMFDSLAKGDSCRVIPVSHRKDEIGQLFAAARVFRDKAAETEQLLEQVSGMHEQEIKHAHAKKLDSLGQLAAGIAHEINTPLQCVASNVEFLEESYSTLILATDLCLALVSNPEGMDSGAEAELRTLLESQRFQMVRAETQPATSEAAESVRRVVEIIRAMKAMSHPGQAGKALTDVNEIIRSAATLSRNRWKSHAELELRLEEVPRIEAHAAELTQVMLNLIVNAADAIAEVNGTNSVTNGTNSVTGSIWVSSSLRKDWLVITVEDTGPGIPESIREKIFDPFFTTKEVGQGTGQGLSISRDIIVNRHGGSIDVESSAAGTRFILELPYGSSTSST